MICPWGAPVRLMPQMAPRAQTSRRASQASFDPLLWRGMAGYGAPHGRVLCWPRALAPMPAPLWAKHVACAPGRTAAVHTDMHVVEEYTACTAPSTARADANAQARCTR